MKLSDLKALMGADLVADFQKKASAPDDLLQGLLDNGIPLEWAENFAETFPSLPVSKWPRILYPPRLHPASRNRSMLSSKMELQNAETKSKRVKIAASTTTHETDARKALFAANVTPQQVADELKVGRSTVNAWLTGGRSIPKRYRDRLKARYKISTTVWPNQAD